MRKANFAAFVFFFVFCIKQIVLKISRLFRFDV